MLLTYFNIIETKAKLQTLKSMVENVVAFFYLEDSASATRALQLLDGLPT
jgi:hypothetical protein